MTGVFNRAGTERRIDWAIARARKEATDLSVLFLDLDHFKQINDTHGHAAGDACLNALVRVIGEELQYGDLLGRYGGEEFLMILPDSSRRHARDTAERIRLAVEQRCAKLAGMPEPLTVSIGLAECIARRYHDVAGHARRPGDVCRQARRPQSHRDRRAGGGVSDHGCECPPAPQPFRQTQSARCRSRLGAVQRSKPVEFARQPRRHETGGRPSEMAVVPSGEDSGIVADMRQAAARIA